MPLMGLCIWVVVAWALQMVLTARQSWAAAYGLAMVGAPLLTWLWLDRGAGWTLVGLAVMTIVLRWPLRRAFERMRGVR